MAFKPASLFATKSGTSASPRGHSEPEYTFLCRSDWPETARVRELIDQWYRVFPDDNADLAGRFRSTDDHTHIAAAFELYTFTLLSRLGYSVQVHPTVRSLGNKTPDFLVTAKSGYSFIVEAISVDEKGVRDRGADARLQQMVDGLNKLPCNQFRLELDVSATPGSRPIVRKLRQRVGKWLQSLDHYAVTALYNAQGHDSAPHFRFAEEDWRIGIRAIPLNPRDGDRGRLVGRVSYGLKESVWWQALRDAVVFKAKKYKKIDLPYLIAVNGRAWHLKDRTEMEALFGQEAMIFDVGKPNSPARFSRRLNGAWTNESVPQLTYVSGVIFARDVSPWTVAKRKLTLYLHPWPTRHLRGNIRRIDRAIPKGHQMRRYEGLKPGELFGLSSVWPEGAPVNEDGAQNVAA